jgi:hypothetical protein
VAGLPVSASVWELPEVSIRSLALSTLASQHAFVDERLSLSRPLTEGPVAGRLKTRFQFVKVLFPVQLSNLGPAQAVCKHL